MGLVIKFGLPAPQLAIGGSELVAVFVELIITFFLMLSVYAVLYSGKVHPAASGLLIGMTLAVGHTYRRPSDWRRSEPGKVAWPSRCLDGLR